MSKIQRYKPVKRYDATNHRMWVFDESETIKRCKWEDLEHRIRIRVYDSGNSEVIKDAD